MRDRRVADRYARALLAAARAENVLADVGESYEAICEVVRRNPALPGFLEGPQVADAEKKHLLDDVFADRVEPILMRFLHLLLDKNRIEYLLEIGEEFAVLVERERGYLRAHVTTAVPLPADLEAALSAKLAAVTGSQIIMEKSVDPAAIAGVRVTLGDRIIDGTVRTHLDKLRQQLGKAPVR